MVVAAVLLAAVLHASWNAMAKGVADRLGLFARSAAVSTVFSGAVLVAGPHSPDPASWPWLAASVALHTAYYVGLLAAYRVGDFNQTYPLARGIGPFVVAIVAATVIGEKLHPAAVAGVVLIAAAIGVLGLTPWHAVRRNRPALVAAVLTGLLIAAYTLVDGIGVRRSGSPIGYTAWLLSLHTVAAFGALAVIRRTRWAPQAPPERPAPWWLAALTGAMSMLAYGLVLWAQSRGALAAVAALRESSVVVAALLGAWLFKEPMGRLRIAASIAVAAGVVLLATG